MTNKIQLTEEDRLWLKNTHPKMEIYADRLVGKIFFHRTYNDVPILDSFQLEILLEHNDNTMLPKVKCKDDRIENIAESLNLRLDELHINEDKTFCLTVAPKEKSFVACGGR